MSRSWRADRPSAKPMALAAGLTALASPTSRAAASDRRRLIQTQFARCCTATALTNRRTGGCLFAFSHFRNGSGQKTREK